MGLSLPRIIDGRCNYLNFAPNKTEFSVYSLQAHPMKKIHIVFLVLIAAGIAFIAASFGDFSTYQTFESASKEPGKKLYVIGFLQKDKEMEYDPKKDPNHFIFYAKDKKGNLNKVIFNGEKPRDIEKSEQIVMMGV